MAVETSRSVALAVVAPAAPHRHTAGALLALALGTATSGLLLPIGVTLLVGAAGLAGVLAARANAGRLRAALVAHAARRARERWLRDRERALAAVTFGRETFAELVKLVDEIAETAPELADRFELDDLLDRYATCAIAHDRAMRAAVMFDRTELERARDAYRDAIAPDARRLELFERRIRCGEDCRARVDVLLNDLALIADLIRLIAQRAACPDELLRDDRIERQLAELDDDEAARNQLAAELR